jgi:hypothetical protein
MTVETFKHHILVGRMADKFGNSHPRVFVTVHWDGEELHFTGVEGPKPKGDAWGSCGQIDMHWREDPECWIYGGREMPRARVERLMELWDRWHLNHMNAGSPNQEAWLRANPFKVVCPESHLTVARKRLAAVGLEPDHDFMDRKGQPYSYGSEWVREEVPHEVLVELLTYPTDDSLPDCWQR